MTMSGRRATEAEIKQVEAQLADDPDGIEPIPTEVMFPFPLHTLRGVLRNIFAALVIVYVVVSLVALVWAWLS